MLRIKYDDVRLHKFAACGLSNPFGVPQDNAAYSAHNFLLNTPVTVYSDDHDEIYDRDHVDIYGHKPSYVLPSLSGGRETSQYLNNIRALFTTFSFDDLKDNVQRENPVCHHSLRGDVDAEMIDLWPSRGFPGRMNVVFGDTATSYCRVPSSPAGATRPSFSWSYPSQQHFIADALVKTQTFEFPFGGRAYWKNGGGWYTFYLPDFSYALIDNMMCIRLVQYRVFDSGKRGVFPWTLVFEPVFGTVVPNVEYAVSSVLQTRLHIHSPGYFWWPGSGRSYDYDSVAAGIVSSWCPVVNSTAKDTVNFGSKAAYWLQSCQYNFSRDDSSSFMQSAWIGFDEPSFNRRDHDLDFSSFVTVAESFASDALNSLGYTALAALEEDIASFGVNQLENLTGVKSLFGLVDVVRLINDAYHLKFSKAGSVLARMLDILTDARLVYSYALSPTQRDIVAIRDGARHFRHRWLDGGQFQRTAIRGSETYSLANAGFGAFAEFASVTISVKVVGRYKQDAYLPYLLPMDAIGLLPRPSRIWAMIPFSFVFDNVFNVQKALEMAESIVCFPGVFETEYTIGSATFSWEPDDLASFLADNQLGTGQGSAEYRSYMRFVIRQLPVIGPSRILASLLASRIPSDLTTYGALVYKVFL
jgi:hypothetical protein